MTKKELQIYEMLYKAGGCLKSDILLYATTLYTKKQAAYSKISKMIKDEYIEEIKIKPKKIKNRNALKTNITIIKLTRKGTVKLIDYYENNNIEINEKLYNTKENIINENNILQATKTIKDSRIKVMLSMCNVLIYPSEKPSYEYLIKTIYSRNMDKYINETYIDNSLEQINEYKRIENIKEMLKKGIYYSKSEITDALKLQYGKNKTNDDNNASKIQGIIIKDDNIFFIYIPAEGSKKRMRIVKVQEENLINQVIKTCNKSIYVSTIKEEKGFNSQLSSEVINAIVISTSGKMLITAMANSAKDGKIKNSKREIYQSREIISSNPRTVIDAGFAKYKNIFSITDNKEGIEDLKYVLSSSPQKWRQEADELIKNEEGFSPIANLYNYECGEYKLDGKYADVVYMPVYNIKLLNLLHIIYSSTKKDRKLIVITNENKMETIAKSLRLGLLNGESKLIFYGINIGKNKAYSNIYRVDEDKISIYDERGYIAGISALNSDLKENGKTLEINGKYSVLELASKMNYTFEEFYNKYARKEISFEDILPYTKDIDNSKKKKPDHILPVELTDLQFTTLKELASKKHMSVSAYMNANIAKIIKSLNK